MRLNFIIFSFFILFLLLLSEMLQVQICILGCVYEDYNNNGVQDGFEFGFVGFIVNMVFSDGMIVSISINVDGDYIFCDVLEGNFYISVVFVDF